jgi:hypothetical protein
MLFSCKISSAVLTYLESKNEDLSLILDSTSLPEEFLRDSSYWMEAADMEKFLETAEKIFSAQESLFQRVGHAGPELRSWGVLDSVLRMMPRPQEILAQPERFLSYFVSPAPPIDHLARTDSSIEFDLPISADQYPRVTEYLGSAFESLPVYVGQPPATCEWKSIHLKMNWSLDQSSIFSEIDPGHQISPELLRQVVASLEKHQLELEAKNRDLQAKNTQLTDQLSRFQSEMETRLKSRELPPAELPDVLKSPVHRLEFVDSGSIKVLQSNLARLGDYMVRAQQLITMLIAQDRLSPAVQQAMKRVDWDKVKTQFSEVVKESRDILEKTERHYEERTHV